MNPIIIGALAGTAMGLLSSAEKKQQERQAEKERKKLIKVEKERQRYGWWTGDKGEMPATVPKHSVLGELMKGGITGAAFGQGFDGETAVTEKPYQDTFTDTGNTYTPGVSEAPWREGAPAPTPGNFDSYYNRPDLGNPTPGTNLPEHELAYTAQGQPVRRMSSPGAVGNFYPYGK